MLFQVEYLEETEFIFEHKVKATKWASYTLLDAPFLFIFSLTIQKSTMQLPRELEEEAAGAADIRDIFECVAEFLELALCCFERLGDAVLGEVGVVEALVALIPFSVEERGVGVTLAVLRDEFVVEDDVVLGLALGVLESFGYLIKDDILKLTTRYLELFGELGIALLTCFLDAGDLLGLSLAEFSCGDDLAGHFILSYFALYT